MTYLSRRSVVASAATSAILLVKIPFAGPTADPIFAAVAEYDAAMSKFFAARESLEARINMDCQASWSKDVLNLENAAELNLENAAEAMIAAERTFERTAPTTAEGMAALMRHYRVYVDGKQVAPLNAQWLERVSAHWPDRARARWQRNVVG